MGRICVDLFTDSVSPWMEKYKPRKVTLPDGYYYTVTVKPEDRKKLLSEAFRAGIRYRYYEERWARSPDYRKVFFETYKGPYQCRYCGRRLNRNAVTVDHIVPVAQVKKSPRARALLTIRGIDNVNDPRNLAPACPRCNYRKKDKMGLWVVRGILGKYRWFWPLEFVLRVTASAAACVVLYIVLVNPNHLF